MACILHLRVTRTRPKSTPGYAMRDTFAGQGVTPGPDRVRQLRQGPAVDRLWLSSSLQGDTAPGASAASARRHAGKAAGAGGEGGKMRSSIVLPVGPRTRSSRIAPSA